ncbi:MAG: SUF system NifU family Fe-S cluster assembly protein [bacterium]
MNEIEILYNDIIMDHSVMSVNKKELNDSTDSSCGVNPSCGDEITLKLKIEENIIVDAAFSGKGCAISISSTSIMIDLIKGKTLEEAKEVIRKFDLMIDNKSDDALLEELEEAIAFENISKMPARIKCATLPYRTLEKMIASHEIK